MEESCLLTASIWLPHCTRPSAIASQRSQRETCAAPYRTAPRARGAVGEIGVHGHSVASGGPSPDFTPELSISARDNTPPSSVRPQNFEGQPIKVVQLEASPPATSTCGLTDNVTTF